MFKRCLQAVIIAWGPATETTYSAVVRTRQSPPLCAGLQEGGGGLLSFFFSLPKLITKVNNEHSFGRNRSV